MSNKLLKNAVRKVFSGLALLAVCSGCANLKENVGVQIGPSDADKIYINASPLLYPYDPAARDMGAYDLSQRGGVDRIATEPYR